MKKVYKIMISSLMVASFTMQHASEYFKSGAGALGNSRTKQDDLGKEYKDLQPCYPELTVEDFYMHYPDYEHYSEDEENFWQYLERMKQDARYENYIKAQGEREYNGKTFQKYLDSTSKKAGAGAGTGGGSASSSSSSIDPFEAGAGAGAGGDSASSSSSAFSGIQEFNPEATRELLALCKTTDSEQFAIAANRAEQAIYDGANVNHIDNNRQTPLYWACRWNNLAMVELLLGNGAQASINLVDIYRQTPLYWAYNNKNLELVKLLLAAKNEEGQPVLDLSVPVNINVLHDAIDTGQLHIVHAIIESGSFNLQNSITVEEIINSLQDQNFVPREKENLFNTHYPALGDEAREAMIRELAPYLSSGLK